MGNDEIQALPNDGPCCGVDLSHAGNLFAFHQGFQIASFDEEVWSLHILLGNKLDLSDCRFDGVSGPSNQFEKRGLVRIRIENWNQPFQSVFCSADFRGVYNLQRFTKKLRHQNRASCRENVIMINWLPKKRGCSN